ncbi:hypothetical protein ACN47E_001805 [Coniothyrium glycines]
MHRTLSSHHVDFSSLCNNNNCNNIKHLTINQLNFASLAFIFDHPVQPAIVFTKCQPLWPRSLQNKLSKEAFNHHLRHLQERVIPQNQSPGSS